jgi:preprotein translocase subunit SecG|tara:strand:- start:9 stop:362 length:354 start_codon:yes stop_codon:yes gene_type:complete
MQNIILTIHLIITLALICIVLIQRSEGGGLGIGGGGGGGMTGRPGISALGKVTWALGVSFVITSITLTVVAAQKSTDSSVLDNIELIQELKKDGDKNSPTVPTLDGSSPLTPPRADK